MSGRAQAAPVASGASQRTFRLAPCQSLPCAKGGVARGARDGGIDGRQSPFYGKSSYCSSRSRATSYGGAWLAVVLRVYPAWRRQSLSRPAAAGSLLRRSRERVILRRKTEKFENGAGRSVPRGEKRADFLSQSLFLPSGFSVRDNGFLTGASSISSEKSEQTVNFS